MKPYIVQPGGMTVREVNPFEPEYMDNAGFICINREFMDFEINNPELPHTGKNPLKERTVLQGEVVEQISVDGNWCNKADLTSEDVSALFSTRQAVQLVEETPREQIEAQIMDCYENDVPIEDMSKETGLSIEEVRLIIERNIRLMEDELSVSPHPVADKTGDEQNIINEITKEAIKEINSKIESRPLSTDHNFNFIHQEWAISIVTDKIRKAYNANKSAEQERERIVGLIENTKCPDGYDKGQFALTLYALLTKIKAK